MKTTPEASDDFGPEDPPADFPRPIGSGSIAGSRPKLILVSYKGHFYAPGCTPPEVYERWNLCETIAKHLRDKSLESQAGKRSHMTEIEILAQYFTRLSATGWVSASEARWTIRRTAELLNAWPVPKEAQEAPSDTR